MSARGGRDRFRREYPSSNSRYGDKSISVTGRNSNNNPPSRHLWIGNLPHQIVEEELAHRFLQFGPLESVAFQPGRSYAFINFKRDEDAIDAMEALQGFPLTGNPLRIEFAKADKPSTISRDEDYYSWNERSSGTALRGSPFSQREFRGGNSSPEPEKLKPSDKNAEPSESKVLWIGFPAVLKLKVDELTLRKVFSPFGEIDKITTFPGRSYAFVRFRSLMSACRARDTLHGKLFGNPRVHICFAKSDTASSTISCGTGMSSGNDNAPLSPFYNSSNGPSRQDRMNFNGDYRHTLPSPNWGSGDSDTYDFNARRGSSWATGSGIITYEEQSKVGVGGKRPPPDIYEPITSPSISRERRAHLGDFPNKFPPKEKGAFFEDPWALPEDVHSLHEAKKLKTASLPQDRELPEYPFSELERQKHVFPRLLLSDFRQHEGLDNGSQVGKFSYRSTLLEHRRNSPMALPDRSSEGWKRYDSFQMGNGALQSTFVEKRRLTPESDTSSLTEWKWDGIIAKGGTPVCHARCFPVGKVMHVMLPEFLNCTARTGLDILSRHYYHSSGAWVVFFVPGNDADIESYNEFLHYLEEKQRAAVAKLDDKTTLFLVPPSDFSEKVLKVPGRLSISGVVLRLENPGSNHGPVDIQRETTDNKLLSYHENILHPKPWMPSATIPPSPSISELGKSGISSLSFLGNKIADTPSVTDSAHAMIGISESHNERSHDYPIQQRNPTYGQNWSSHNLQNLTPRRTLQPSHGTVEPNAQDRQQIMQREVPAVNSSQQVGGISGYPLPGSRLSLQEIPSSGSKSPLQEIKNSLSVPLGTMQPEQLAQLAASLLGQQQQRQSGSSLSASALDDFRQTNRVNVSGYTARPAEKYALENSPVNSELSTHQFGQVMQLQKQQQMSSVHQVSPIVQREQQIGFGGNQEVSCSGLREDAEADPQKRLQATLQLAAVLLQQIQQGKRS